ncbi:MAG: prolipoprotein diacylglyceryl transferase [Pseudonocardiales bacterium]|nr:prolipoprotein diacylglyceryl transferase [Pseudonocardiales bacterium]
MSRLETTIVNCELLENHQPQALGMTYTWDPDGYDCPRPLTVRFTGSRVGGRAVPGHRDAFDVTETVDEALPRTGRITLTRRVEGLAAGTWAVAAEPVPDQHQPDAAVPAPARAEGRLWVAAFVRAQAPGARIGAWPALVALGVLVGLLTMLALAAVTGLPVAPVLGLAVVACLAGLGGARVYFAAEQALRGSPVWRRRGMCLQGFVLAALLTVVGGAALAGLPVGTVADITAAGLVSGVAVGRVGCFLGGCCAGRPTSSRFGVWSSDRRLGVRRVPTQLLESALAAVLGVIAVLVLAGGPPRAGGVVAVTILAVYAIGRQVLLSLRALPRRTTWGQAAVVVLAVAALVVAVTLGGGG